MLLKTEVVTIWSPIEFLTGFQKFAYALKPSSLTCLPRPGNAMLFLRIQISTNRFYFEKKIVGFSLLIAGRTKTTPAFNKIAVDYIYFNYQVDLTDKRAKLTGILDRKYPYEKKY